MQANVPGELPHSKPGMPSRTSSSNMEALQRLAGSDEVLSYMIRKGYPLTREGYIALNWAGDPAPQELDEEERKIIELLPSEGG